MKDATKVLFVLSMAVLTGQALYFHMGETERKCFIEEIPEQTRIIVNYKMEQQHPQSGLFLPSSSKIGMHVEVRDPQDNIMLSRVYRASGNISFSSRLAGGHVICLHSNATTWFGGSSPLRIHLNIKSGGRAVDYEKVAKKERLTYLQLKARQLLDQVEQIEKEQDYQIEREERFRMTSDSTNLRVMVWALAQTILLLTMGVWQMMHLKKFFKLKKMV